jgi:hypothetical protein
MTQMVPFRAEHWLKIDWQDSQKPFAHLVTAEVAESFIEGGEGQALLSDEGEVIAVAGVSPTRVLVTPEGQVPLASQAVAAFSPRFKAHIKLILRAIGQFLDSRPERRITMQVWPADTKAARFARRLGFEFERAEYEDAIGAFGHLYARVRR